MKWYSRSVSLGGVGDDRYALMECQTSELCIHEYSCNYMLCYCKIGLIEKVSIWRTEGPKSPIEQGPGWWWAACQLSHRHTPLAAHQRAFIWVNTSDLMHPGAPLRPGEGGAGGPDEKVLHDMQDMQVGLPAAMWTRPGLRGVWDGEDDYKGSQMINCFQRSGRRDTRWTSRDAGTLTKGFSTEETFARLRLAEGQMSLIHIWH